MADYEAITSRGAELAFKRIADLASEIGCIPATTITKSFTQDPVGWRVHLVEADAATSYESMKYDRSLCGLSPRHGWGLDMFIHSPCKRCETIAKKRLDALLIS